MHPLTHTESPRDQRNRYILPTSLTAIACFFAVLFAGAKISHIIKVEDVPTTTGVFASAPDHAASR